MGSSRIRSVSLAADPVGLGFVPVGLAALPVGLAAVLAAKDGYFGRSICSQSRPCYVPPGYYDVRYENVEIHKSKSPIITAELERIFNDMHQDMHQTKDISSWRIPTDLLVFFVGEVEMAHQYFDMKKCVREELPSILHDSNPEEIFDLIVSDNRFNKVWEEAIKIAVEGYISELKEEHRIRMKFDFMMYLKRCRFIDWESKYRLILEDENIFKKFPDLSYEDIQSGLEWCRYEFDLFGPGDDEASYRSRREKDSERELNLLRKRKMKADVYAAVHGVFALVFKKREEGCALDQNPEVEVAKVIVSDIRYTHAFSKDGPMENLLYQARTVMVRSVPLNASKLDVKELFMPLGGLEHVEMKRGDKYQTAYVTFEYPEGVDDALLLQRPTILDLPVRMRPLLGSEQRQAVSARLRSEVAKITRAEDSRNLSEALMKYAALNRRYFPNQ